MSLVVAGDADDADDADREIDDEDEVLVDKDLLEGDFLAAGGSCVCTLRLLLILALVSLL